MPKKCNFSLLLLVLGVFHSSIVVSEYRRSDLAACVILEKKNLHYLKQTCESSFDCRLRSMETIPGNGSVVRIKCTSKSQMVKAQDFAVCFDGQWYPSPKHHTCIDRCGKLSRLSSNLESKDPIPNLPWNAMILHVNGENIQISRTICGGTLIAPDIVLTAYSCVIEKCRKKKDPNTLQVGFGQYLRNNVLTYSQIRKVRSFFEGRRNSALVAVEIRPLQDMVLMRLDKPVDINDKVMPACFDPTIQNYLGRSPTGLVIGMMLGKRERKNSTESYRTVLTEAHHIVTTNMKVSSDPIGSYEYMDTTKTEKAHHIVSTNMKVSSDPIESYEYMKTIQLPITNCGASDMEVDCTDDNHGFEFSTSLLNWKPGYFGAGFVVKFSNCYYLLGVHVMTDPEQNKSIFNDVYVGKIRQTIKEYVRLKANGVRIFV